MLEHKAIFEVSLGRSIVGTIVGAAAIILALLGLVNFYPMYMIAISTILVGVSMLLKGGAIASEYSRILRHALAGGKFQEFEINSGVTAELLVGGVGIVLGVLALIGVKIMTLTAVAVIIAGAGLVIGSSVLARLHTLKMDVSEIETRVQRIAEDVVATTTSTQILVGIGAIVLGILSLLNVIPVTLTLVALLAIGGSTFLSGSAFTGRLHSFNRH